MELIRISGLIALTAGFLLDLLLGDPKGWWHPVISIGALITRTEKMMRRLLAQSPAGEFIGGSCLAVFVSLLSFFVPFQILRGAYRIHPGVGILLEAIACYYILATKSLKTESMHVAAALKQQGLAAGRQAVARIVGRDTKALSEAGIVCATIETIAENTSDGVIAPLFYLAIGGPAFGFFYKAVNTMDSMIGYRNKKYLNFGRTAARLDDLLNFLPARITAWLMIACAKLVGLSTSGAYRIYQRDHSKHDSPNSAHPEAAMAGALGIQLAGPACYFGQQKEKPFIGDREREVEIADISRANKLLYVTAIMGLILFLAVSGIGMIW
jgi:adenosylcobinamide-phosphate synthase